MIGRGEWWCAPWRIKLQFVDGCSMFLLFADLEPEPREYCESLDDAMQRARYLEAVAA